MLKNSLDCFTSDAYQGTHKETEYELGSFLQLVVNEFYSTTEPSDAISNIVDLMKKTFNKSRSSSKPKKPEFTDDDFKENKIVLATEFKTERVRQVISFAFAVHIYGLIDCRTTQMFTQTVKSQSLI